MEIIKKDLSSGQIFRLVRKNLIKCQNFSILRKTEKAFYCKLKKMRLFLAGHSSFISMQTITSIFILNSIRCEKCSFSYQFFLIVPHFNDIIQ